MSCRCNNNNSSNACNSQSACALKDILGCLDELNTQDLRTLKCVISRILSCC